jgi:hypothetical protein
MQATVRTQGPPRSSGEIWEGPYILRKWAYFWLALTALVWATPYSFGLIICGGIALHGLRGTRESAEALGILAFLIILGKTSFSLGRWVILFAAFGRMIWDSVFGGQPVPRLLYALLFFFAGVLALSVLSSQFPLVSGLKVTAFTLGVGVVTTALYRTRHLSDYWLSWLFTLGVFILLASVPMYGLSAGYGAAGAGYQGILVDPQTFGPVAAAITALLTGLYFFRGRTPWLVLLCVGLGWVGVYLSLARTALLALSLAGGIATALGFVFKPETWAKDLSRALGRPAVMIGLLAVLALGALQWTAVQSSVESFLAKDDGSASLVQALERSRGALMSQSMANFWENPLTGIGFGAPSDPVGFAQRIERGPYGIPVSASVEKGFMPTAVLEETGIVGALLTVVLLAFLFIPVLQHPDPTLFWVMTTCLFVNFGEMIFFSVGGMGFLLWFVMAFCHVAALRDGRGQQTRRTRPPVPAGQERR